MKLDLATVEATPAELAAVFGQGPVRTSHGIGSEAGIIVGAAWYPCAGVANTFNGLTVASVDFRVDPGPEGTASPLFLNERSEWHVDGHPEAVAWLVANLEGAR